MSVSHINEAEMKKNLDEIRKRTKKGLSELIMGLKDDGYSAKIPATAMMLAVFDIVSHGVGEALEIELDQLAEDPEVPEKEKGREIAIRLNAVADIVFQLLGDNLPINLKSMAIPAENYEGVMAAAQAANRKPSGELH